MTTTLRGTLYLATLAVLAVLISGCAITRLPSAGEYGQIRSGKLVIVLLRVTSEVDGKPFDAFGSGFTDSDIGLALGSFTTGGDVNQITPVFLSTQTRESGWTYLLLEPGFYYLAVQPRRSTDAFSYAAAFKAAPLWRLEIPAQERAVYVGTLHLPGINRFWSGMTFIPNKIVVRNEEELARKTAADFFPEFGAPVTALMQRHDGPKILTSPNR